MRTHGHRILLSFTCCLFAHFCCANVLSANIHWKEVGQDSLAVNVKIVSSCSGLAPGNRKLILFNNCDTITLSNPSFIGKSSPIQNVCVSQCTRCGNSANCSYRYGEELYEIREVIDIASLKKGSCCELTIAFETPKYSTTLNNTLANSQQNVRAEQIYKFCQSPLKQSLKPFSADHQVVCKQQTNRINLSFVTDTLFDSLKYRMAQPLKTNGSAVQWKSGFSYDKPLTFAGFPNKDRQLPSGFHLDSNLGILAFTPLKIEGFPVRIVAEAFRNGKQAYTFERYANILLEDCSANKAPQIDLPGYDESPILICANDSLSLNIESADPFDDKDSTFIKVAFPLASERLKPSPARNESILWKFKSNKKLSGKSLNLQVEVRDNACPIPSRDFYRKTIRVADSTVSFDYHRSKLKCGMYRLSLKNAELGRPHKVLWIINGDTAQNTGPIHSLNLEKNGQYIVEYILDGCFSQSSGTDTINIQDISSFAYHRIHDSIVCPVDTFVYKLPPSLSQARFKYNWTLSSDPEILQNDSVLRLVYGVKESGRRFLNRLQILDTNQCSLEDTFWLKTKEYDFENFQQELLFCSEDDSSAQLANPYNGKWSGSLPIKNNEVNVSSLKYGTYSIYYRADAQDKCVEDSASFSYQPSPAVRLRDDFTTCFDAEPSTLTPQPLGGIWTGNGIKQNAFFDPSLVIDSFAELKYRYTDFIGCAVTDTLKVQIRTFKPAVSISKSDYILCDDSPNDTLFGSPAGGIWQSQFIRSDSAALVLRPNRIGKRPHELVYYYEDSIGCYNKDTITVFVRRSPSANFFTPKTNYNLGDSISLSNNSIFTRAAISHWYLNADSIPTVVGREPILTAKQYGWNRLKLVLFDSLTQCNDTALKRQAFFVDRPIDLKETKSSFSFYPQPMVDYIHIRTDEPQRYSIRVLDLNGRTVHEEKKQLPGTLYLHGLSGGMYFLEFNNGNTISRKQISIVR